MGDRSDTGSRVEVETLRQAQDRASHAEEHLRLLVDSVQDYAIFMLDPAGRVRTWNAGAERTMGYARGEILGRPFSTFCTPEDVAAGVAEAALEAARAAGRFEDERWRQRKDGTRFCANLVISAMRHPGGELVGFAVVTRDISDRRRAEEELARSEQRFRLLVDRVRDYAIFSLDADGYVRSWNAGAQRIKGYTTDEILGSPYSRFFTPEDRAAGRPQLLMARAAAEGSVEDEGWRLRKDGTRFWADAILSAVRDDNGTLIGFAKVTRDLTERRNAEEERVGLARAEEAVRLRDEFLSVASHELKTPLAALQLQIGSLRAKLAALDPALATRLGRAERSAERLSELIEALLDVSRIASGRFTLDPQPMLLGDAVGEVVERFREPAARARSTVSVDVEGALRGRWDRLRVEQVVTNLLANALKYAAGTPVEISARRDGGDAVLCVCDRGPGIPEEHLGRIFGRFERAVPSGHYGGLGLGLYVTKQIAEAHGGSATVENRPGGGACFTVRLPLSDA